MPQRYAREFRRKICERLLAGERISKVSNESGVSPATLHRWKDQALIDAGLKEGTKSIEVDELAQARKTIEELEAELAAVKAGPVQRGGACQPKRRCQVAEALSNQVYSERVASRVARVSRSCFYEHKFHVPSEGLFQAGIGPLATQYGNHVVLLFSTVTEIGALAALDRSGWTTTLCIS